MKTFFSKYDHKKDRYGPSISPPIPNKIYNNLCRCRENTRITLQSDNPHTGKWQKRYEKYKISKTFGEMLRKGALATDVPYDMLRGILKIVSPLNKKCIKPEEAITQTDKFVSKWAYKGDPKSLKEIYKHLPMFSNNKGLLRKGKTMLNIIELTKTLGSKNMKEIINTYIDSSDRSAIVIARMHCNNEAKQILDSEKPLTHNAILSLLRKWGFKKNERRYNVMRPGVKWIYSDNIGILKNRLSPVPSLTPTTKKYPYIFEILTKYLQQKVRPDFRFTSICINKNYQGAKHVDRGNFGPSAIVALGDFENGQLRTWEADKPKDHNIKKHFLLFDGNVPHEVLDYKGNERYSLVFFTVKGFDKVCQKDRRFIEQYGKFPKKSFFENLKNS